MSGKARQKIAASALASGSSIIETARRVGVSDRTIRRWLADPDFSADVRRERDSLLSTATAALHGAAGESVSALRGLLGSRSDVVKLGAAKAVFDLLLRSRMDAEIADRLAAVERRLEQSNQEDDKQ